MNAMVKGTGFQDIVQMLGECVPPFWRCSFVIITAIERTSIDGVEFLKDVIDAEQFVRRILVFRCDNVQPSLKERNQCENVKF